MKHIDYTFDFVHTRMYVETCMHLAAYTCEHTHAHTEREREGEKSMTYQRIHTQNKLSLSRSQSVVVLLSNKIKLLFYSL